MKAAVLFLFAALLLIGAWGWLDLYYSFPSPAWERFVLASLLIAALFLLADGLISLLQAGVQMDRESVRFYAGAVNGLALGCLVWLLIWAVALYIITFVRGG